MPDNIPTPTKPYEVICFYPIAFPIENDEDAYVFIAVDVVSTFLFQIGVEQNNDIDTVLNNIEQLMVHDQFRKPKDNPFTLVLHKHEQYKENIEAIIKPYGGKVAFNDPYLAEVVGPPMEFLFQQLSQR